ncbi:MAG: Beta-galactosidase C-terminal domain, partial [Planctomycetota bacterium]|nr:Beta-galactosidase C-terminal domain [Planctomycetota bacterium]
YGEGEVYYLAARAEDRLLDDLYQDLLIDLEIPRALDSDLPAGVTAQMRTDGERDYIFLLNFNAEACRVDLGDTVYYDVLADAGITGTLALPPFGSAVLERAHQE